MSLRPSSWLWLAGIAWPPRPLLPDGPRVAVSLDRGWRFQQSGAITGAEERSFDDSSWTRGRCAAHLESDRYEGTERSPLSNSVLGVGWYRLRFAAPPELRPRRRPGRKRRAAFSFSFDGVGALCRWWWLNGHYLGKHAGAFARFRFDATAAIDPSGENVLVVKADNSRPQPGVDGRRRSFRCRVTFSCLGGSTASVALGGDAFGPMSICWTMVGRGFMRMRSRSIRPPL